MQSLGLELRGLEPTAENEKSTLGHRSAKHESWSAAVSEIRIYSTLFSSLASEVSKTKSS